MKDLIKALPAMHDLAGQAGIELPQILGKVDNGIEEASSCFLLLIKNQQNKIKIFSNVF